MKNPLVSIIMPAYNAAPYIAEAIQSVLIQQYPHFELIIINDGSTDHTAEIISTFSDDRIRMLSQPNTGVSAARNLGLTYMDGSYFCFLDADDILPPNSLKARVGLLDSDPSLDFVDGVVKYVDEQLNPVGQEYQPNFIGDPLPLLLRLDRRCLFGNTWMIRRNAKAAYQFNEELKHSEDLYFYLSICHQQKTKYSYTPETVLLYRRHEHSAMKNLPGLEKGYDLLLRNVKAHIHHTRHEMSYLKYRITRIMFLSYLFDGKDPWSAIQVIKRYWRI